MNNNTLFSRVAAISAVISAPVALSSWLLIFLAFDFNPDLMASGLSGIITLGIPAARYFHLAWKFADLFGYCLLLAPTAFYLWRWLTPRQPNLVTFCSLSALAYIVTGAITVSLAGGTVPPMMRAYAEASAPQQEILLLTFQSLFDMIYYGVGPLAWFFGGLWWFGIGTVLRSERPVLGIATMILGLMSVGLWIEQTFRLQPIVETPFLLLAPIWAIWLGVIIWRRAEEKSSYSLETAAAA